MSLDAQCPKCEETVTIELGEKIECGCGCIMELRLAVIGDKEAE